MIAPIGGKLTARPVRHSVAMAKETPGDGSMLTPLRKGQALYRSMFGIEHDGVRYDVDVNFFDSHEKLLLYPTGIQHRVPTGKASLELPDEPPIAVALTTC